MLEWYCLFWYLRVSIMGKSHFLLPLRYGFFFLRPFGSIYHARIFIPSSVWLWMVLTQIITQVCKKIMTLTYPLNIITFLKLEVLYPLFNRHQECLESLLPLWMSIIDAMHSPIHHTNTMVGTNFTLLQLLKSDVIFLYQCIYIPMDGYHWESETIL